jgi:AraC family transcriptional regulator of adaptative response/methylated-DNA-[protein]-cysteine methyltransferase
MPVSAQHYQQIARAIDYFVRFQAQQPGLEDVATYLGLSESHFQRLFSEWVGVSPKKFLQYLTKEKAKQRMRSSTLLDSSLDAGLSGTGRLHDLLLSCEGVTPGEYKNWGAGLRIYYGLHDSPFGQCLLAQTDRGVCKLAFFDDEPQAALLIRELFEEWPNAVIERADIKTSLLIPHLFPAERRAGDSAPARLHLLMKGSKFQLQVWEALLRIPEGELVSYRQLALGIGGGGATRAVASAVAKNHLGYLIPCHRVIRSTGEFNQYRWGATRKMAMIGWEAIRTS